MSQRSSQDIKGLPPNRNLKKPKAKSAVTNQAQNTEGPDRGKGDPSLLNHRDQSFGLGMRWACALCWTDSTLATYAKGAAISCCGDPAHPVKNELSLSQSWTFLSVLSRWLPWGYAELHEKSTNIVTFVCLQVTGKPASSRQAWEQGQIRVQIAARRELLFWGHRAWERLIIPPSWLLRRCYYSAFSLKDQNCQPKKQLSP